MIETSRPCRPASGLAKLSVLNLPSDLKASYRRLMLIAHRAQIPPKADVDADTLIVSTDWLAWRQCVDADLAAIHFEAMLEDWPAERGNPRRFFLRAIDWCYDGDTDWTRFRGVSIGHLLLHSVGVFSNSYERLSIALDRLIVTFGPSEIVLVDFQGERKMLSDEDKVRLVSDLAARHAIAWRRMQVDTPEDAGWPDIVHSILDDREQGPRRWLRHFYSQCASAVFRLQEWLTKGRPKVLILSNPIVVHALIDGCERTHSRAMVLASQHPKTWAFLAKCWRNGVLLAALPHVRLDDEDLRQLEAISKRLTSDAPLFRYVRSVLLNEGGIQSLALEIKALEAFFDSRCPDRVMLGDIGNKFGRMVAELAFQRGIPLDESLNGMYLVDQPLEARCGGHGRPPLLATLLSWGEQNEAWMQSHPANVPCVRVGYPGVRKFKLPHPVPPVGQGRVLVLPAWIDGYDTIGMHSNKYAYTAEVIQILRKHGYKDIRLKLHPGPPSAQYFQEVMDYFALDCPVFKQGPIGPHIDWADFVVGPINSGSFPETMAAGKTYIPICTYPTLVEKNYISELGAFETPALLDRMLETGQFPDQSAVKEYLLSPGSIADPVQAFWQAMDQHAA